MNKRENTMPDLRGAFPEMPQDCRDALLRAARSVKEENDMIIKRFPMKTILIAALILAVTMTAAIAATETLGWTDFFGDYDGTVVPQAAQEILNATEEKTYQAGSLSFTVRQLLCDGRLAMSAVDIRTADGSDALYCCDPGDVLACNGENGKALASRLGLPENTAYLEAAKTLGLPLYWPRVILQIGEDFSGGEGMEDPLWNADNTMTYFSMAFLDHEKTASADVLPATLLLRVSRLDPETGEEIEASVVRQREAIEIPIHGVIAEKDFTPVEPFIVNGYTLVSVHAEQTVCGLYLDRAFEADEEARKLFESPDTDEWELIDPLWSGVYCRENGVPYPEGMSLTGEFDSKDLPILHFRDMISVDEMPDTLVLQYDERQVVLK